MKDSMETLARKGTVTILERPGRKTMVAIQQVSGGSIVTLEGHADKNQLLAELCQIVRNWPDLRSS